MADESLGEAALRGPVHGGGRQHACLPRALAQPRRPLLQGVRGRLGLLRASQLQGAPVPAGEGRVPALLGVGGHAAQCRVHPPRLGQLDRSLHKVSASVKVLCQK